MKPGVRLALAAFALTFVGVLTVPAREARAQPGVPYGPYSLPRAQFYQVAPSYYPTLNSGWGGYYGGRGYRRPYPAYRRSYPAYRYRGFRGVRRFR